MMIVVAGEVDFPPQHRDAALAGARPLIDMALAEPGCRHYAWTADPHLAGRAQVFEEWDEYILWESYVKALQYWSKMACHLT